MRYLNLTSLSYKNLSTLSETLADQAEKQSPQEKYSNPDSEKHSEARDRALWDKHSDNLERLVLTPCLACNNLEAKETVKQFWTTRKTCLVLTGEASSLF